MMRDRFAAWRNRLVASPAFQRFAAGFPLTRPIAERQSQALFDLCAGFVYAQILAACVELDLFRMLADGPLALAEIARRSRLPEPAAERLLKGAVALKLIEARSAGRYGLAMLGAAMLGNPGVARMIAHHHLLYRDLADPLALLRGEAEPTRLSRFWAYAAASDPASAPEGEVAAYSALMAGSQHFVADDIVAAYDFRRHRSALDIGGGEGAFLAAVARQAPDLTLTVFDL
ncbi:MAG: methyltransferase, partial [Bosea sp. (in: a-proteobacteria)]